MTLIIKVCVMDFVTRTRQCHMPCAGVRGAGGPTRSLRVCEMRLFEIVEFILQRALILDQHASLHPRR